MIEEIKILLGETSFSDSQISLAYKLALNEVEEYCQRDADESMKLVAEEIAIIKLNRMGTEGLASQSFSGVSESFVDGYPTHIQSVLNRKRKIKVVG